MPQLISQGLSLGWWIFVFIFALFLITFIISMVMSFREYSSDAWAGSAFVGGALAALTLLVGALIAFPYNPKYWQVYTISGTVESVSNVLSQDGGDLTRTPIVTLNQFDTPIAIEDPRAIDLVDKDVTLVCHLEWVYLSADRINCSIGSVDVK